MTLLSNGKSAEIDYQPRTTVEGEIREFVRRDSATYDGGRIYDSEFGRQQYLEAASACRCTSVQEIDRVDFRTGRYCANYCTRKAHASAGNRRYALLSQLACNRQRSLAKPQPWKKSGRLGDANYRATLNERGSLCAE